MSNQGLGLDPDKGATYIPPRERFPNYQVRYSAPPFDPMEYCKRLRERVASGELTWDEANTLWRAYADAIAAVWIDYPGPGPCAFSEGEAPNPFSWSTVAVPYYDDGWVESVPTTKGQTVDEYFESFDPATWFGMDDLGYAEPPPQSPFDAGSASPGAWFDESDLQGETPHYSFEPEDHLLESDGGPTGDISPSPSPHPLAPLQPVRPLLQGADGVFRNIPMPPRRPRENVPTPEAPIELSPYMSLPVDSSFSIKGDSCGCANCQSGGPCQ